MKFADWLKDARARHGLTLLGLAAIADISHATVQRLESGERSPSRAMVEKLAAALGESEDAAMFAAGFIPSSVIDYVISPREAELLRLSRDAEDIDMVIDVVGAIVRKRGAL